jgi:hypothetical protein
LTPRKTPGNMQTAVMKSMAVVIQRELTKSEHKAWFMIV